MCRREYSCYLKAEFLFFRFVILMFLLILRGISVFANGCKVVFLLSWTLTLMWILAYRGRCMLAVYCQTSKSSDSSYTRSYWFSSLLSLLWSHKMTSSLYSVVDFQRKPSHTIIVVWLTYVYHYLWSVTYVFAPLKTF